MLHVPAEVTAEEHTRQAQLLAPHVGISLVGVLDGTVFLSGLVVLLRCMKG